MKFSSYHNVFVQFLMKLQGQDFIAAWQIQKELVKLCPNDETIKAFSQFLPAEAEEQRIEQEQAEKEPSEYESEDDEEDEEEEEEDADQPKEDEEQQKPKEEGEEDEAAVQLDADGNPMLDANGNPIHKEKEEESSEYGSDYDS